MLHAIFALGRDAQVEALIGKGLIQESKSRTNVLALNLKRMEHGVCA